MIHFEALQAQHGDCFVMRWNDKVAVIDGGPSGTYPILKKRLDKLAGGNPLPISLMMVSHIDDDHINGLLALMQALVRQKEARQKLAFDIKRFWFNSFADLIAAAGAPAETAAVAALASNDGELNEWAKYMSDERTVAVLASVGQGRNLRDAIVKILGKAPEFVAGSATSVAMDGLDILTVGPLAEQVDALRKAWKKAPKAAKSELADYLDTSTANLSSIVCLVQQRDGNTTRKLMLTGDARGDYILDGLHRYGPLKANDTLELDLLKVPHHGSSRDVAQDFFETLPARHYVISANGKYNNPDQPTLKWLVQARGTDKYTIHLTNKLDWMDAFFDRMSKGKNFNVNYRDPSDEAIIDIQI